MRGAAWVALWILLAVGSASAEPAYDDPNTPTGWAWAQIRDDKSADFNEKCGKSLDPHKREGWEDPCRQVPAQFLAEILTSPRLRDRIGRHGVRLIGARIDGTIDVANAEIRPQLWIIESRIEGGLDLSDSRLDGPLLLQGTTVTGNVFAERMHADSTVLWRNSTFTDPVDLRGAKVAGNLAISGSTFAAAVNANSLNVAGSLFMTGHARFDGEVDLRTAKVAGNLEMETASFAKAVAANSVNIAGNLFMNGHARFDGEVDLRAAKVAGNLEMDSSAFAKGVNANSLTVQGSLFMRDHATFGGEVNLGTARIGSNLEMDSSAFSKKLNANRVTIEGSLFLRDHAMFGGEVNLGSARIGGNLEMDTSSFAKEVRLSGANIGGDGRMEGAVFAGPLLADTLKVTADLLMSNQAKFSGPVFLAGAKIGGDLALSNSSAWQINLSGARAQALLVQGLGWWCAGGKAPANGGVSHAQSGSQPLSFNWPLSGSWQRMKCDETDSTNAPALILRNAYFADFQDSPDAWPPSLDLEGFRYDRLGASGETGRSDMRRRSPKEWADWLARNDTFSTQPYTELASVLAAAGHRDTADAILLIGRERERGEAWTQGRYISWAWLTFLSYVAGYGIGLYTFLVLIWVTGLTVLGADILWYSERARRRGLLWRLGASLHRLLPVIELSKEFTDFFNNQAPPGEEPDLSRLQVAYFAGHALAGWILGFFLIAAMGGIIQKS